MSTIAFYFTLDMDTWNTRKEFVGFTAPTNGNWNSVAFTVKQQEEFPDMFGDTIAQAIQLTDNEELLHSLFMLAHSVGISPMDAISL